MPTKEYPSCLYHPDLLACPAPAWLHADTWIVADTHFFHANITRLADRPENWQDQVVDHWRSVVQPEDDVFHLGDFALGRREDQIRLAHSLPGRKHLLLGNHDRTSLAHWEQCGFETAIKKKILVYPFGDLAAVFSHRPVQLVGWDGRPVVNIHGHVHNHPHPFQEDPAHINVSLEMVGYRLLRLGQILDRAIQDRAI